VETYDGPRILEEIGAAAFGEGRGTGMWTYTIGPVLALLPRQWRAERFGELGMD
jgi:hypothetical protein